MTKKKKKKEVDLKQAEKLGSLFCTIRECAYFFDIPRQTLYEDEEFREAWERGKANARMSHRRLQLKQAKKSDRMSIWLGKQYLGQTDKQEVDQTIHEPKKVSVNVARKKK